MKRNGWKRPKTEEAEQASDGGLSGEGAADDCSSSELSQHDEKQVKTVPAESEPGSAEPRLAEKSTSAPDAGAFEGVAEISSKTLEDQTIDDALDDGDTADEEVKVEAVGWTIQLSRGRIVDVTERHVVLSDDVLGFITFEDGESLSIEGIRRIGW